MKTRKSAAKRMKITGTGKVMRRKGWKGHLLSGKNATRKRRLSGAVELTKDNRENAKTDASVRIEINDARCLIQDTRCMVKRLDFIVS